MDLLYFILASWGMTQILVYGTIFENQRDWIMEKSDWLGTLIHCPMCTGFWVGVFLWLVNGTTTLFNYDYSLMTALCLGCLSSGASYVFSVIVDDNGLRVERSNNNETQTISQTCTPMQERLPTRAGGARTIEDTTL